jgi:hypothetical protein
MKQLSRKKIQDMIDLSGVNISSRRSSGGSGAGGGGGVSSAWVDEHYVSKDFFARLFTINGTDENDDDVVVEPNDLETDITNIQAMVGLWTEQYLSALGQGSGGGGGGILQSRWPVSTAWAIHQDRIRCFAGMALAGLTRIIVLVRLQASA